MYINVVPVKEKLSNMRREIFSKSEAAAMRIWSEIFSKSKVASLHMREQMSLAMQPMYSESVTLVANYCRNTRNICTRNVWRNMCRAVFEISGNFSKFQEWSSLYILWNPASQVGNLSQYKKTFQLCWCWLHCLHQYGYHTTVTVTCTASLQVNYP